MKKIVFVLTVFCFAGCMQAPDKPQAQPKVPVRESGETPTKENFSPKPGGGDMSSKEQHLHLEIDRDADALNERLDTPKSKGPFVEGYPDAPMWPEEAPKKPKPPGDVTGNSTVTAQDASKLQEPILDLKLGRPAKEDKPLTKIVRRLYGTVDMCRMIDGDLGTHVLVITIHTVEDEPFKKPIEDIPSLPRKKYGGKYVLGKPFLDAKEDSTLTLTTPYFVSQGSHILLVLETAVYPMPNSHTHVLHVLDDY